MVNTRLLARLSKSFMTENANASKLIEIHKLAIPIYTAVGVFPTDEHISFQQLKCTLVKNVPFHDWRGLGYRR